MVIIFYLFCVGHSPIKKKNRIKEHYVTTGDPVVKNQSCNAGDAGSIPGRGIKIPHAMEQLSPQVHHN